MTSYTLVKTIHMQESVSQISDTPLHIEDLHKRLMTKQSTQVLSSKRSYDTPNYYREGEYNSPHHFVTTRFHVQET